MKTELPSFLKSLAILTLCKTEKKAAVFGFFFCLLGNRADRYWMEAVLSLKAAFLLVNTTLTYITESVLASQL